MNSQLSFSEWNVAKNSYTPPPPRLPNGGLYTGELFKENSQYGNVPVIPDTGYLIHYNLRSANPPPDAIYQYPGYNRPGNNFQAMPGVEVLSKKYNIMGNVAVCNSNEKCTCRKCTFTKYAYL